MDSENGLFIFEEVFAGSTFVILARIVKSDNSYLTIGTTNSIRVDVFDLADDELTPVNSAGATITDGSAFDTPSAAATIHDTLVTDARWKVDSIGANFVYKMKLPTRDRAYEVRITIGASNSDTLVDAFRINSR